MKHIIKIVAVSIISLTLITGALPSVTQMFGGILAQDISVYAASNPKIVSHYYKGDNRIKYYSIKGAKYKSANKAMKKQAAKAYKEKQKTASGNEYTHKLISSTPTVKFNDSKKISILIDLHYEQEANGNWYDLYESFNFYNAKKVTLKKAFKTKEYYTKANDNAIKYFDKKGAKENNLSNNGILDKPFWWSKSGLTIQYYQGMKGAWIDNGKYFGVPLKYKVKKSYLKYFSATLKSFSAASKKIKVNKTLLNRLGKTSSKIKSKTAGIYYYSPWGANYTSFKEKKKSHVEYVFYIGSSGDYEKLKGNERCDCIVADMRNIVKNFKRMSVNKFLKSLKVKKYTFYGDSHMGTKVRFKKNGRPWVMRLSLFGDNISKQELLNYKLKKTDDVVVLRTGRETITLD